jgi:DNA-directed RNA polymerase specialized sigma24 family protein
LIAAFLMSVQVAATAFAPPLDVPVRAVTETSRTDSGITRRFTNARRVVFRRTPDGYRAEVTIEGSEAESADDDPAAMFRAGFERIAGRTVVLRLDGNGRVTAIEDQAAVWKAFLDGIAALAPPGTSDLDRKRASRIRAIVAMLAPLPPERQRATLASLVEPLIAADVAAQGESPPQTVRVPASSAFGTAQLDGIRSVKHTGALLEVTVTAAGALRIQAPDGPVQGRIAFETVRVVDPATGLVRDSREHVSTRLPDGSSASERTRTTRLE